MKGGKEKGEGGGGGTSEFVYQRVQGELSLGCLSGSAHPVLPPSSAAPPGPAWVIRMRKKEGKQCKKNTKTTQKTQRSELLAASPRLLSTCSCAHGDALSREVQLRPPPKRREKENVVKMEPFGHPRETGKPYSSKCTAYYYYFP